MTWFHARKAQRLIREGVPNVIGELFTTIEELLREDQSEVGLLPDVTSRGSLLTRRYSYSPMFPSPAAAAPTSLRSFRESLMR